VALYQLSETGGVAWTAELWLGATVLSVLIAVALGVVSLYPVPAPARAKRETSGGRGRLT